MLLSFPICPLLSRGSVLTKLKPSTKKKGIANIFTASPLPSPSLPDQTSLPPPHLREISTLASWTVSSSKPGCSIPQLRHPSTSLFWQSDGPQPHYLNIHFFKLVRIVGLRLFLDFEADESYTPTRIIFLAGSGQNDLVEWGEMRLEQPRGWVWADFSGVGEPESDSEDDSDELEEEEVENRGLGIQHAVDNDASDFENAAPSASAPAGTTGDGLPPHSPPTGDPMHLDPQQQQHTPLIPQQQQTPNLTRPTPRLPFTSLSTNTSPSHPAPSHQRTRKPKMPVLRCHLVQIKILENHQNGKDTHLRGLQIFARDNETERGTSRSRKSVGGKIGGEEDRRVGSRVINGGGGGLRGLAESEWMAEPSIR